MIDLNQVEGNRDLYTYHSVIQDMVAEGVQYVGMAFVPLSQIKNNPDDNVVRVAGLDRAKVELLKLSLDNRIDYGCPLPVLERLPAPVFFDGELRTWQVVDGYNRLEAMLQLGFTHYWYQIVEFGNATVSAVLARTTAKLKLNTPPPSGGSSNHDIFAAVNNLVKAKELKEDFNVIKQYIVETCCVTPSRATLIADKICAHNGVAKTFRQWTQTDIKKQLRNLPEKITSHGVLDIARNQFGWTCLKGYEKDTFEQAIKKFAATSKESYVVGHVSNVNTRTDLDLEREKYVSNWEELEKAYIKFGEFVHKHKRLPINFMGFLPQESIAESLSKGLIK